MKLLADLMKQKTNAPNSEITPIVENLARAFHGLIYKLMLPLLTPVLS